MTKFFNKVIDGALYKGHKALTSRYSPFYPVYNKMQENLYQRDKNFTNTVPQDHKSSKYYSSLPRVNAESYPLYNEVLYLYKDGDLNYNVFRNYNGNNVLETEVGNKNGVTREVFTEYTPKGTVLYTDSVYNHFSTDTPLGLLYRSLYEDKKKYGGTINYLNMFK